MQPKNIPVAVPRTSLEDLAPHGNDQNSGAYPITGNPPRLSVPALLQFGESRPDERPMSPASNPVSGLSPVRQTGNNHQRETPTVSEASRTTPTNPSRCIPSSEPQHTTQPNPCPGPRPVRQNRIPQKKKRPERIRDAPTQRTKLRPQRPDPLTKRGAEGKRKTQRYRPSYHSDRSMLCGTKTRGTERIRKRKRRTRPQRSISDRHSPGNTTAPVPTRSETTSDHERKRTKNERPRVAFAGGGKPW